MDYIFGKISEYFIIAKNTLFSIFGNINVFDILDIIILSVVIYKVIELFIDSRAKTLLKGIALIIVMYLVSVVFDMTGINWILEKILGYSLIILAIIFQPELRRGLEKVGRSNIRLFGKNQYNSDENVQKGITDIVKATFDMSNNKIGALIVIERKTPLGEIANSGTIIDSQISTAILCNIFYPKSPLHDGAVIISDNRIKAAGCILPLTASQEVESHLGTRHRAALGISENSDALTIVVSEETGVVSITLNGKIETQSNSISLQQTLTQYLSQPEEVELGFVRSFLNKFKHESEESNNEQN